MRIAISFKILMAERTNILMSLFITVNLRDL